MTKVIYFIYRLIKYRSIILGSVNISSNVFIRYSYIKGKVSIASGASIFRSNLVGNIKIGKKSSITGPYTYFHTVDKSITIGDRCAVAPKTTIITSGHNRFVKAKSFSSGGKKTEGHILIGDDVWIGAGAIVLANSEINNNISIGAGSVLLGKVYEENKFYAGVPAIEK